MTARDFPVLKGYGDRRRFGNDFAPGSVPWSMVEAFEARAQRNHGGQTLERLAERGGLSPYELNCVLDDEPCLPLPGEVEEQVEGRRLWDRLRAHEAHSAA